MASSLDITDILAIHERIARYSLLADQGDAIGMGDLLAHAEFSMNGRVIVSRDREAVVATFSNPRSGGPGRRHVTTNIIVEATGPDSASSTCYFLYTQTLAGAEPRLLQTGMYEDRFSKVDGSWRFVERRIVSDGQAAA